MNVLFCSLILFQCIHIGLGCTSEQAVKCRVAVVLPLQKSERLPIKVENSIQKRLWGGGLQNTLVLQHLFLLLFENLGMFDVCANVFGVQISKWAIQGIVKNFKMLICCVQKVKASGTVSLMYWSKPESS